MKLSQGVQEGLLAALLYDREGATRVRQLLTPKQFDLFFRDVAEAACDYLDRYKKVPGDHAVDLFEALVERNPDSEPQFAAISAAVEAVREELHVDYVIDKAAAFARHQAIKTGISNAFTAIDSGTENGVEEAASILRASLDTHVKATDPGIWLHDTDQSLAFLDAEEESFPTGIELIDKRRLGPRVGELHLFAGASGSGKSWWLIHLAKQAILAQKRVLYVSLELHQKQFAQRFWQSILSITQRPGEVITHSFNKDEAGRYEGLTEDVLDDRPSFRDDDIRDYIERKASRIQKAKPVLLKSFPPGAMSIQDLELYLDQIEARGFIPDIMLVDYVGEMALDVANYRHSIGDACRGLRRIAIERRLAGATAIQINRDAQKGNGGVVHGQTAIAESAQPFNVSDAVLTYNQTDEERELGLARIHQAKGRGDKDRFTVVVSQSYDTGQFCLDSVGEVKAYMDDVYEVYEDEEEELE